ncbi:hypothetical protein AUR63_05960 [Guyparkeria sp. XI15]|nr:hypothetical protein AUR63_05960 [Guyparkeria sp. XI15]OAE84747.1 hypothetical protein AWR35_05970 [Guyparkeria sp. WRN-7]
MMDNTPPFDLIAARVDGMREERPAPGKVRAMTCLCPAHKDRRPSLLVSEKEDGDILLHCRAGCSFFEIRDALGIEAIDLIPAHKRHARVDGNHGPDKGPRFSAWQAIRALAVDVITVELAANQVRRDGWLNEDDMAALASAHDRIRGTIMAGGFRV